MAIYHLKIGAAIGGRSLRDLFTNGFFYQHAAGVGASAHSDIMEDVSDAFSGIFLSKVHILRVTSSLQPADGSQKVDLNSHMTLKMDKVGSRVVADNVDPVLAEVVAEYSKDTSYGRSGSLFIRGAFSEAELDSDANGGPVIKGGTVPTAIDNFGTALVNAITGNAGTLIIPGSRRNGTFTSAARTVSALEFIGLTTRDRSSNRQSLEQARKDLIRREINEVERQRQAAKSANPGISDAGLAEVLKDSILRLAQTYGWEIILQLVIRNLALRAIMLLVRSLP